MKIVRHPQETFPGVCLIVVPHMDDCVLACGGLVSRLPHKERIHFVYATDGAMSPVPPHSASPDPGLPAVRMDEARAALTELGVPAENVSFLGLPDGQLGRQLGPLAEALVRMLVEVTPDHVFVPFRYDRHPDHLALNRATHAALARVVSSASIFEYFVYYRWKLLPGGDVRRHIDGRHLLRVDYSDQAERKLSALRRFRSQTTCYFDWQSRPILTEKLVAEVCREPELFLRYDPAFPERSIFLRRRTWIRLVDACESRLKIWKDRVRRMLGQGWR